MSSSEAAQQPIPLILRKGVTAELDADGHLVGLEVLDASERVGPGPLKDLVVEKFPLVKPGPEVRPRTGRQHVRS